MKPKPSGTALMAAKRRRKRPTTTQLGTPPQADGKTVNGASTTSTRIGY